MLCAIDKEYLQDTISFLQCLAFSLRPLETKELAEIITIDFELPNGPTFDQNRRYQNSQSVLARCLGFVSESNGKSFYLICFNFFLNIHLFRKNQTFPFFCERISFIFCY